jgi:hypothetical protein
MFGRRFLRSGLSVLLAAFVLASVNACGVNRPALGPGPVVIAAITGRLDLCARHAPGRCRVGSFTVCGPVRGCASIDRVRIVGSASAFAGASLRRGRFSVVVAPGHYTVELLEDGPRVRGRVIECQSVTVHRYGVAHVTFKIAVP